MLDGTPHYTNEFGLIVGPTAKSRKGTGFNRVMGLFNCAEEASNHSEIWSTKIRYGMSTGEGLVAQFVPKDNDDENPPPMDMRRLFVESEFARTLIVLNRPDNTLSAILRQAWDARSESGHEAA
jgi:hypothetical protein